MKTLKITILALTLSIINFSCKESTTVVPQKPSEPTITKLTDFAGGVRGDQPVCNTVNDKIYVIGNVPAWYINGVVDNEIWEYQPSTDKWTKKGELKNTYVSVRSMASAVVGDKIYWKDQGSLHELDVVSNIDKLSKGPTFFGSYAPSFILQANGKNYLGFFQESSSSTQMGIYEFNNENYTYKKITDAPFDSRTGMTAFTLNKKAYFIGGFNSDTGDKNTSYKTSNEVWELDLTSLKWTKKAPFDELGREGMICFVIKDKAYLGGGAYKAYAEKPVFYSDILEYNATSDKWTKTIDMPLVKGRAGMTAIVQNNKAYFGLGTDIDDKGYKDWYVFQP